MKLLHTTTTVLNTREFNKLSDKIIDAIYALNQDIQDLYDIHINYISNNWRIDFIPMQGNLPVINVDTYTDFNSAGDEILHITPQDLSELPNSIKFKGESASYDLCMNYVAIFEFILSLYDLEFEL